MRYILAMALLCLSFKAHAVECGTISLPFALPPESVSAEWCDAEWQEWLDAKASAYCAKRPGSAWCACYEAGAYNP